MLSNITIHDSWLMILTYINHCCTICQWNNMKQPTISVDLLPPLVAIAAVLPPWAPTLCAGAATDRSQRPAKVGAAGKHDSSAGAGWRHSRSHEHLPNTPVVKDDQICTKKKKDKPVESHGIHHTIFKEKGANRDRSQKKAKGCQSCDCPTLAQIHVANSLASAAVHVFPTDASSATKRMDKGHRRFLSRSVAFHGSQKCQRDSTSSKSGMAFSDRKAPSSSDATRFCLLRGLDTGGITAKRPQRAKPNDKVHNATADLQWNPCSIVWTHLQPQCPH